MYPNYYNSNHRFCFSPVNVTNLDPVSRNTFCYLLSISVVMNKDDNFEHKFNESSAIHIIIIIIIIISCGLLIQKLDTPPAYRLSILSCLQRFF